jgi:hypothetical protein
VNSMVIVMPIRTTKVESHFVPRQSGTIDFLFPANDLHELNSCGNH